MKVLYISHVKESSGWGTSAENQMLALDAAGVDVVCRNVTLTSDRQNVHPRVLELEQKDSRGCDVCIQHVLPHHLIGSDMFKRNIAFLEAESTSLSKIAWIEYLKLVNEIWVPNQDLCHSLRNDDWLHVPIHIVHHPCDYNRYTKKYPEITIPQLEDKFVFYYIKFLSSSGIITGFTFLNILITLLSILVTIVGRSSLSSLYGNTALTVNIDPKYSHLLKFAI